MERFNNQITVAIQTGMINAVDQWLADHQMLSWLVQHPIYTLVLVLLALLLGWGLLGAIARLSEQIWLTLLRLPLQLGRWVFELSINVLLKPLGLAYNAHAKSKQSDRQQRLAEIWIRLEALRQEQDTLMQELQTLLDVESPRKAEPPQPEATHLLQEQR